jgi:hypothetical protein
MLSDLLSDTIHKGQMYTAILESLVPKYILWQWKRLKSPKMSPMGPSDTDLWSTALANNLELKTDGDNEHSTVLKMHIIFGYWFGRIIGV